MIAASFGSHITRCRYFGSHIRTLLCSLFVAGHGGPNIYLLH